MKIIIKLLEKIRTSFLQRWSKLNLWLENKSTLLSAWSSVIAIVGVPIIMLGAYATWIQVKNYFDRPDIVLHLDSPTRIHFRLFNISSVILREPKYQFSLWDLDARIDGSGDDPGNLLIPVKSLTYIRPKSGIGPWAIQDLSDAASRVPDGHVVFGWVSIQCPDCKLRRHYWLLFRTGEGGSYYEIPPDEQPSIMKNLTTILKAGRGYGDTINMLVPANKRINILDRG